MAKASNPPPSHKFTPQYHVLGAGTEIKRIFDPTTKHKVTATSFRYFGPLSRFDHQPRIKGEAQVDPDRGIIYGGFTLSCCLVEIFAEDGNIEIGQHELATLNISQDLKLLDIRTKQVWNAGATVASIQAKRSITQAWGSHFYNDAKAYGRVDGLIYNSANNGEEAIALYERAKPTITAAAISIQKMQDSGLRKEILLAGRSLGMPIKFV